MGSLCRCRKTSEGVRQWPRCCESADSVVVIWGDRIGREGEGATAALLDVAAGPRPCHQGGRGTTGRSPRWPTPVGLREAGCLPDTGPGLTSPVLTVTKTANTGMTGKATEEIRAALESGELKTLLLFGVDPLARLPGHPGLEERAGQSRPRRLSSRPSRPQPPRWPMCLPARDPRRERRHRHRTPTAASSACARARLDLGDIRPNWGVLAELVSCPGPRHRHLVPTLSLRSSRRSCPLLRRHHRRGHRRPRHPLAGHPLWRKHTRADRGARRGVPKTLKRGSRRAFWGPRPGRPSRSRRTAICGPDRSRS